MKKRSLTTVGFMRKINLAVLILGSLFILFNLSLFSNIEINGFTDSGKKIEGSESDKVERYLSSYEKIIRDSSAAASAFQRGLAYLEQEENKSAGKEFDKAKIGIVDAKERLIDIKPPKAAKSSHKLTIQALKNFEKGTRLLSEGSRDSNNVLIDEGHFWIEQGEDRMGRAFQEVSDLLQEFQDEADYKRPPS